MPKPPRQGRFDRGILLLEHGANVAQTGQYGMTPLHYTLERHQLALLVALLAQAVEFS